MTVTATASAAPAPPASCSSCFCSRAMPPRLNDRKIFLRCQLNPPPAWPTVQPDDWCAQYKVKGSV